MIKSNSFSPSASLHNWVHKKQYCLNLGIAFLMISSHNHFSLRVEVSMLSLPWWGVLLVGLALSQLIIFLVTIYFHRACSHRSVVLAPSVNKVCRFLSWYLIAMDPREFAAIHRKHHAKCDTEEDPHSPANHGWHGVLFGGLGLYRKEAKNTETIEKYGKGLPIDSWERFYQKHKNLGIVLFGVTLLVLMGWSGLIVWGALMIWIPFWAAGVINGLGHHIGYRNYQTDDLSTNLIPWGFWVGGEELHNNHHAYPTSAKFSQKPWEFDIGWSIITMMEKCGLATVRHTETSHSNVGEFLQNRHQWLQAFHKSIEDHVSSILPSYGFSKWKQISSWNDKRQRLSHRRHKQLMQALSEPTLAKLHELEEDLRLFWRTRGHATSEQFEQWRNRAKEFGWSRLNEFAETLPVKK